MGTVRCKIVVTARHESIVGGSRVFGIDFAGVQAGEGEDSVFGRYTPAFDLKFSGVSPEQAAPFAPGRTFYTEIMIPEEGEGYKTSRPSAWLTCSAKTESGTAEDNPDWMFEFQPARNVEQTSILSHRFSYATLKMTIRNQHAAALLKRGSFYHFIFTPALELSDPVESLARHLHQSANPGDGHFGFDEIIDEAREARRTQARTLLAAGLIDLDALTRLPVNANTGIVPTYAGGSPVPPSRQS